MVNVSVKDNTYKVFKGLENLKGMQVYVGIPQEKTSRNKEEITNAELAFILSNGVRNYEMRKQMEDNVAAKGYHKAYEMYLQTHGSPKWQIPPRPIIEPAIEDDKENISEILKEAMKAELNGDHALALEYLNKAGLEGQAVSQDWFTNEKNGWAPNAPYTIEQKGSDKPNIDTGELRKAITYVVEDGE